jgi:diguanylate cyclase (GGDEF)-like protein
MKILVIDRDTVTTQLIKAKLEELGHEVIIEVDKSAVADLVLNDEFGLIFYDPSPLLDARSLIFQIRRSVQYYPYVVVMSKDIDKDGAYKANANELLSKPLDSQQLPVMIKNSERLCELIARFGDENEDFPNAGGIISKSAVNQLFLSGLERADRYGETSNILFIKIDNLDDIYNMDGAQAATYTAAKLSKFLTRLRRQSDIIAQTGRGEFCLILQRPRYDGEPIEAAKRFTESVSTLTDIAETETSNVTISITLVSIPDGGETCRYLVHFDSNGVRTAI